MTEEGSDPMTSMPPPWTRQVSPRHSGSSPRRRTVAGESARRVEAGTVSAIRKKKESVPMEQMAALLTMATQNKAKRTKTTNRDAIAAMAAAAANSPIRSQSDRSIQQAPRLVTTYQSKERGGPTLDNQLGNIGNRTNAVPEPQFDEVSWMTGLPLRRVSTTALTTPATRKEGRQERQDGASSSGSENAGELQRKQNDRVQVLKERLALFQPDFQGTDRRISSSKTPPSPAKKKPDVGQGPRNDVVRQQQQWQIVEEQREEIEQLREQLKEKNVLLLDAQRELSDLQTSQRRGSVGSYLMHGEHSVGKHSASYESMGRSVASFASQTVASTPENCSPNGHTNKENDSSDELEVAKAMVSHLQKAALQSASEAEDDKKMIKQLQAELVESKLLIEELEDKVDMFSSRKQPAAPGVESYWAVQLQEMRELLHNRDDQIQELDERVQELSADKLDFEDGKAMVKEMEKSLRDTSAQLSSVRGELEEARIRENDLQLSVKVLQNQLKERREKAADSETYCSSDVLDDESERQILTLQKALESSESTIMYLRQDLNEMKRREQMALLGVHNSVLAMSSSVGTYEIDRQVEECHQAGESVQAGEQRIVELEQVVKESISTIATLRSDLESAREREEAAHAKVISLEADLEQSSIALKPQIENTIITHELEELVVYNERQVETLESSLKDSEAKIQTLQLQLETAKCDTAAAEESGEEKVRHAHELLAKKLLEMDRLRSAAENAQTESELAQARENEFREHIAQLQMLLDESKLNVDRLESELQHVRAREAKMNADLATLNLNLEESNRRAHVAETVVSQAESNSDSQSKELKELACQLELTRAELAVSLQVNAEMKASQAQLQSQLKALEGDLAITMQRNEFSEKQVSRLENELSSTTRQHEEVAARSIGLEANEARIAEMEKASRATNINMASLQDELAGVKEANEQHLLRISSLQAALSESNQALEQARKQLAETELRSTQQRRTLDDLVQKHESELVLRESDLANSLARVASAVSDAQQLHTIADELEQTQNALLQVKDDLSRSLKREEEANEVVANLEKEVSNATERAVEAEERSSQLESDKRAMLTSHELVLQSREIQLDELRSTSLDSSAKTTSLEQEIARLQEAEKELIEIKNQLVITEANLLSAREAEKLSSTEVDSMRLEFKQALSRAEEAQVMITTLQGEKEDFARHVDSQLSERDKLITSLECAMEEARAATVDLRCELEKMQGVDAELEATTARLTVLQRDLANAADNDSALKSLLGSLEEELVATSGRADGAEERVSQLEADFEQQRLIHQSMVADFEIKLTEAENQAQSTATQLEDVTEQLHVAKLEVAHFAERETELAQTQTNLQTLSDRVSALEEKLAHAENELKERDHHIEQLEMDLEDHAERASRAEADLVRLQDVEALLEQTKLSLQQVLHSEAELKRELDQSKLDLQTLSDRASASAAKLAHAENELKDRDVHLEQLEMDLEEHVERASRAETEVIRLREVEDNLEHTQATLQQVSQLEAEATQKLLAVQAKWQESQDHVRLLERQLEELRDEEATARRDIERLEEIEADFELTNHKLLKLQQDWADSQEKCDGMMAIIASLQSELERAQVQVQAADERLVAQQAESSQALATWEGRLKEADAKISSLEKMVQESQAIAAEAENEIAHLYETEQTLEQTRQLLQQVDEREAHTAEACRLAEDRVHQLQAQVATLGQSVLEATQRAGQAEKEVLRLRDTENALEQTRATLHQVADLENQTAEKLSQVEAAVTEYQVRLSSLESELADSQAQCQESQARLAQLAPLEADLASTQLKLSLVQRDLGDAQERCRGTMSIVESLQKDLTEAGRRAEKAEERLVQSEQEASHKLQSIKDEVIRELTKSLVPTGDWGSGRHAAERLRQEYERSLSTATDLSIQLAESRMKIDDLERLLQQMRRQHREFEAEQGMSAHGGKKKSFFSFSSK